MKRILYITLWSLLVGGLVVLLGFVESKQKKMICTSIEITIKAEDDNHFVEEEDIRNIIKSKGKNVIGQKVSSINIPLLERMLNNDPAIDNAEVYASVQGKLHLDIEQRKPIIRVLNSKDEGFYIDKKGQLMPLSDKYTAKVLVANGYINESYGSKYKKSVIENDSLMQSSILDELYSLASYIDTSEFWKAQIAQVYINEKEEAELITRVGDQTIIFGEIEEIENKFKKLMLFYTEAMKTAGWNSYSTINLKYENQIVCTKK